jgi:hypothetical protein
MRRTFFFVAASLGVAAVLTSARFGQASDAGSGRKVLDNKSTSTKPATGSTSTTSSSRTTTTTTTTGTRTTTTTGNARTHTPQSYTGNPLGTLPTNPFNYVATQFPAAVSNPWNNPFPFQNPFGWHTWQPQPMPMMLPPISPGWSPWGNPWSNPWMNPWVNPGWSPWTNPWMRPWNNPWNTVGVGVMPGGVYSTDGMISPFGDLTGVNTLPAARRLMAQPFAGFQQ